MTIIANTSQGYCIKCQYVLRTRRVTHIITVTVLARGSIPGSPWLGPRKTGGTLWVSAQPTRSRHYFPYIQQPGWTRGLNQGQLRDTGQVNQICSGNVAFLEVTLVSLGRSLNRGLGNREAEMGAQKQREKNKAKPGRNTTRSRRRGKSGGEAAFPAALWVGVARSSTSYPCNSDSKFH